MEEPVAARDNEPAFVFTGGCAALDLVATLGHRRSPAPLERMPDPRALAGWLAASGQLADPSAPSVAELARAWRLREAVYCLLRTRIDPTPPSPAQTSAAVAALNEIAAAPALSVRLATTTTGLHVEPVAGTAGEALARIARDAVALLGGPDIDRVKECEHPDCTLVFLDATQSRRRRWCSMDRCGNLVKTAGYRARKKTHAPSA